MHRPSCGKGIPERENYTEESMYPSDKEKLSVAADKLSQKRNIWKP